MFGEYERSVRVECSPNFPNTSAPTTRYTHANSMKQLFYFITLINEIYDEKAKTLVKNGKTKSLTKNSR